MRLERTGVNEPAIAIDILKEQGIGDLDQRSAPAGATVELRRGTEREMAIVWVMYGEMAISVGRETGTAHAGEPMVLTGGDHVILEPGERCTGRAGRSGVGYLFARTDKSDLSL